MLREALGRRGLFKRLGVGALLAASGQDNIARLAQVSVGGNVGGAISGSMLFKMQQARKAARVFTTAADFSTWWREYGKLNHLAPSRVREIDADIAGFRLPLPTKIRMQQERNYLRAKAEAKVGFLARLMRDGNVTIFDDYGGGESAGCATGYSNPSRGFG